jgi:DNA-binding LytR/AlgR family response regulator
MRILIVEDERSIANRLERLLKEILEDQITSLEMRESTTAAMDFIRHQEIDILFLDLNLSGADGFDVLKSMVAESFDTIIVSAYRDKAIEAFEYGVVDFVPKPFDKARLEKALSRISDQRQQLKKLVIKKQGQLKAISLDDIIYFKGANIYTEVHLTKGGKELSNKKLDQLEQLLPSNFARIHKSYIVDMNRAINIIIQPGSKYELQLDDDLILPIGRTRYKELKAKFFNS